MIENTGPAIRYIHAYTLRDRANASYIDHWVVYFDWAEAKANHDAICADEDCFASNVCVPVASASTDYATVSDPVPAQRLADAAGDTWADHPDYPAENWQDEVINRDTRLGYWDWVVQQIESVGGDARAV